MSQIFKNPDDIFTSYICSRPIEEYSHYRLRVLNPFDAPHEVREKYHALYGAGQFMYDGSYDNNWDAMRYVSVGAHPAFIVVVDEDDATTIEDHITQREQGFIMRELAEYIADYVNEEHARNPSVEVTSTLILNAIEAYEGGAR